MRRAFLPILFVALFPLIAGTWLAWQHRFEIDPACPQLTLRSLQQGLPPERGVTWEKEVSGATDLVLSAGTGGRPVVQVLPLPLPEPVGFLMFDFAAQAEALEPGGMPWSDGRVVIEWHLADGSMEPEYLFSARYEDVTKAPCVVVCPSRGLATPVLRVEHLGSSGSFRIKHCRIDVVRETALWKSCRWLLPIGWLAWMAMLGSWGRASGLGRGLLAGAMWVLCGIQWAVPGPWQSIRPLAPLFETPEPPGRVSPPAPSLPERKPAALSQEENPAPAAPAESLGAVPAGGSVLLLIKDSLKQARPLFHVLLFLGPTLAFVFLVGRAKGVAFAALLAGAIEWSQYLYGFGFDSSDWFDLSCDAVGVALALAIHARFFRWWEARRALRDPVAGEVSAGQPT